MSKRALLPSLLLSFAGASGCGGGTPMSPASTVPDGDRARALTISDPSQLVTGPKASGRVGDLLLANTKVRFVIEATGRSRTWFPTTGALLDADRVRAPGEAGQDRLQESVTRLGSLGMLVADKVEIAADGSDGNDAVVRVTGRDIPVPLLQSVTPETPAHVTAVTEYRLAPYAESLEVTTTITDTTGQARSVPVGDLFVLGDYVTLFAPGVGTDRSQLSFVANLRFFAAFGGGVSYGVMAPGRKITLLVPQAEIFGAQTDNLRLPANGSATFTRRIVVAGGDVAGLLPEIAARETGTPKPITAVAGTAVESASRTPIAGAQVAFADGSGPYAIAVSGADGAFAAPLEAGSYTWGATSSDHPGTASGATTVGAGAVPPIAVTLADTGRFQLAVTDEKSEPVAARVVIQTTGGAGAGTVLSGDGGGGGSLPPGDYLAIASRGYEYEAGRARFTVVAGQTVTVPLSIARVVDTSGWLAIDSHTHTAFSVDSQLDPGTRVVQAAADGVDLVIATDHDLVFDLAPYVASTKLAAPFGTVPGCEVSPVPGHINGYPAMQTAASDTDGYWPVEWWSEDADQVFIADLWPKDLFAAIRKKLGAQIVQINHPRSSQGVLNWIGYDNAKGLPSVDASRFDMNWDVIEVCNAGCDQDPSTANSQTMRDWWSFLSQGYRKAAVGVSDQHGDGWLGRARTLVEVHDDDPADLGQPGALDEVWTSLGAGRATVQDGPFVTATVRDDTQATVSLGGLAKATGPNITLHVKVQAPTWIATDTLRVIQNGAEVKTLAITPAAQGAPPVVRFDGDITLPGTTTDAFYVVIVDGASPMAPVLGNLPRSVTNAIYVDRDGNGSYDAPSPR